ncbi:MAG TPA: hypothetical protein VKT78_03800 [Fimbriimonadaceae bacterium]|nr:hypothetical protein [Fimbriimonadaceae bacterium]
MYRGVLAALCLILVPSAFALDRSTTLIIQNQSNTTLNVAGAITTSGSYVGDPMFKAIGPMQQLTVKAQNDIPFCGCSGSIFLQPEHGSGQVVIQFDNPYIGSNSYKYSAPAGWDCFGIKGNNGVDGSGNDATLPVRIEGKVALSNRGPDVPLATIGEGMVQGRVLWPNSFGSPSWDSARSASATLHASGPWGFFEFSVTQPTKFQPYALANSLTALFYNGKWGELIDTAKTGTIVFAALPNPPPGFSGFQFTISRLPIGVPISISVGPVPGATWPARRPVSQATLSIGSLKPSFYCVAADVEADLTPKMTNIAGFDFTVNAEWVGSGAPIHNFVRGSAGSSKSTVQFGTLDAETVAAVSAAAKAVRALPAVRK